MQKTEGLYRLTQVPALFSMFQSMLGGRSARRTLVADYLNLQAGDRVLDVGCGPAHILDDLPQVEYTGFDLNPSHILSAKEHYGDRGCFNEGGIDNLENLPDESFDVVLCIGLFHHLNDSSLRKLCGTAQNLLANGGQILAIDPTFVAGQNWIAKTLAELDSGQNVRTPDEYKKIVSETFGRVEIDVRHDLLRIPYSHCITTAYRG